MPFNSKAHKILLRLVAGDNFCNWAKNAFSKRAELNFFKGQTLDTPNVIPLSSNYH